ncbi:hypothetical protein GCM10010533_54730 [Mycolicibacterium pallens]
MFVDVWGTVAEWVGAVGTTLAAGAAAVFYISDRKRERKAQALLVRVVHEDTSDQEKNEPQTTFTVHNDSDRFTTGFTLVMKHDRKALRAIEDDYIDAGVRDQVKKHFPIWGGKGSFILRADWKAEENYVTVLPQFAMGLRSPVSYLMRSLQGASRVSGNSEVKLVADQPVYTDVSYRIIFRDAHARAWMVSSLTAKSDDASAGDIRRLHTQYNSGRNFRNGTMFMPWWRRIPVNAYRDTRNSWNLYRRRRAWRS